MFASVFYLVSILFMLSSTDPLGVAAALDPFQAPLVDVWDFPGY